MTSFMSKKKKYKFQVDICLEELLEVPFVSAAVLFAKMRLLDGGSFQDQSSRQEVRDHKVNWDAKFAFPCKMMANASTGVMEKCILRISIRKESKGGRSFTKLGFVDLNLAEYAGAGLIHKKALLEGYDARHRQDNSMLKFRIQLNMVSGDILFKVPSPSKHKPIPMDDASTDQRSDEFSSGSLAGSINSGSSGFGSLPKKRTPLPTDLVIGQTLTESGLVSATTPFEPPASNNDLPLNSADLQMDHLNSGPGLEPGHSRNSSNTSQMSKASGYSSISHSRQSSSGDSTAGHIRNALQHESLRRPASKFLRTYTFPKHRLNIPTTILSESPVPKPLTSPEVFHTPQGSIGTPSSAPITNGDVEVFFTPQNTFTTPKKYQKQKSNHSTTSNELDEVFTTPNVCLDTSAEYFDKNFNALQKSASSSVVERIRTDFPVQSLSIGVPKATEQEEDVNIRRKISYYERKSQPTFSTTNNHGPVQGGVLRSKSDFIIPKMSPDPPRSERTISNIIAAFLTPRLPRKGIGAQSTPMKGYDSGLVPTFSNTLSREESKAVSMGNLKLGNDGQLAVHGSTASRLQRKMLLDGCSPVTKLATCESPPEDHGGEEDNAFAEGQRRSSTTLMLNPSSSSIQTSSDTGSLDRAKAAYERRKKGSNAPEDSGGGGVSGRVEITRVNPEDFIADLLKSTNLEQPDDSAETSGLQLFIAKDGTASLGNHEVKSQMSTGINTFKQVVMDDR